NYRWLCRSQCRRPGRGHRDGQGVANRWTGRSASGDRPRRASALIEPQSATDAALTAVFREEAGRLTAALVRALGDFDLAEELVQEALLEAVEHWPAEGIPQKPGAWLLTTARRKAADLFRRQARYREKLAQLEGEGMSVDTAEGDDRLRLIFTCCHPALSREAQVAPRSGRGRGLAGRADGAVDARRAGSPRPARLDAPAPRPRRLEV